LLNKMVELLLELKKADSLSSEMYITWTVSNFLIINSPLWIQENRNDSNGTTNSSWCG
jgi:hypothetical protein